MNELTPIEVIFRKFKDDGAVIALFPYEYYNKELYGKDTIVSYMHVGQHSGADYNHVLKITAPASPKEYIELKRELRRIGYEPKVIKRRKAG